MGPLEKKDPTWSIKQLVCLDQKKALVTPGRSWSLLVETPTSHHWHTSFLPSRMPSMLTRRGSKRGTRVAKCCNITVSSMDIMKFLRKHFLAKKMSGRVWSGLVGSGRNPTPGLLKSSGRIWSGLVGTGRVWSLVLLSFTPLKRIPPPPCPPTGLLPNIYIAST